MIERQEKVFNDLINLTYKLRGMSGLVQNGFEVNDETRPQIKAMVEQARNDFRDSILELDRIKQEVLAVLIHYSKE